MYRRTAVRLSNIKTMNIAILDDHELIRLGLRSSLQGTPHNVTIDAATADILFKKLVEGVPCDLILLDVLMPGTSGIEVAQRLRAEYPGIKIIIVSVDTKEYIINQLKGIASLEEAAEITGQKVQTAENVTLASYRFGNAGNEPAVIGTALALAEGELSAPIQGRTGVFVLKAGAKTVAPGELNVEQEKQQLASRVSYTIPYQAISLVQEKADVVDNRANFQ